MKMRTRNPQNDEFDNFRELTRKLLAISKKELDEQKSAYEMRKGRSTKPAR